MQLAKAIKPHDFRASRASPSTLLRFRALSSLRASAAMCFRRSSTGFAPAMARCAALPFNGTAMRCIARKNALRVSAEVAKPRGALSP